MEYTLLFTKYSTLISPDIDDITVVLQLCSVTIGYHRMKLAVEMSFVS